MTDSELRIRVGERCGWKFAPGNGPLDLPWRNTKVPAWDGERGCWSGRADLPPDYPNDLNAMHEAEKILSGGQAAAYWRELEEICGGPYQIITSTAKQRAIAFVKTATE